MAKIEISCGFFLKLRTLGCHNNQNQLQTFLKINTVSEILIMRNQIFWTFRYKNTCMKWYEIIINYNFSNTECHSSFVNKNEKKKVDSPLSLW